jgi:hypothetical protein
MTDVEPRIERVRGYIQQLTTEKQQALLIEIERGLLRDEELPSAQLLLAELRNEIRKAGWVPSRVGNPSRLFFNPVEPFLIDGVSIRKHRGYIARSSLNPIWLWLCRDVLAMEAKTYVEAARRALLAEDERASERLARDFRIRVVNRVERLLSSSRAVDDTRARLSAYMGSPRTFDDLNQTVAVLKAQDELAAFSSQLPKRIENLEGPVLEQVMTLLTPLAKPNDDRFLRCLIMVKSHLASPAQLVRLAVRAAMGNQSKQIARTPYMLAIALVVAEIEDLMSVLAAKRADGETTDAGHLIKRIHDSLHTVGRELNVGDGSPWGRSYADVRAKVSKLLSMEIEAMAEDVERVLEPRPADELAPDAASSEVDNAAAEKAVALFSSLQDYTTEFAIADSLRKAATRLKRAIEEATSKLLARVAGVGETIRKVYLLQIEAAVRFSAKLFGTRYAATIVKATENALKDQQNTPEAIADTVGPDAERDQSSRSDNRKPVPEMIGTGAPQGG